MAGKGHKELETGNNVGIIKSGKHGTDTVVCDRGEEEEAGQRNNVCGDTATGQRMGLVEQAEGDKILIRRRNESGCEIGSSNELTLRGDQCWQKGYRCFPDKISLKGQQR